MSNPIHISPHLPQRVGIGLRSPHMAELARSRPAVGFLEAHAENFMSGGRQLAGLMALRHDWPISVHAVGLSLGSAGEVDGNHLHRLARLVALVEPCLVSEHLSWAKGAGAYLNALLPLPYDAATLTAIAVNISRVQDRLRRQVLVENPSAYLRFKGLAMDEAEFLRELVRRTGCGILCDVNNIYVSTENLGGDAFAWLDALPTQAVRELHVAGHHEGEEDGVRLLIDNHGSPVADSVWALYAHAARRFPHAVTLLERDTNIPPLVDLVAEAALAERHRTLALAPMGGYAHARAA
ncbi:MAG TPA: DUF692 domain-containing protein [Geminicoccaceae bacterium]|nr:DUF692 domain-containing protein [Geminicoccus sp.]HMU49986.1 DUF692 domain-containing protein [Geminicoccaceae bacterium]